MRLYEAFQQSKQLAYQHARNAAAGYLLFPDLDFARNAAQIGSDPYRSGLAANRAMLETVIEQLSMEQLISQPPHVDPLFAEGTHRT